MKKVISRAGRLDSWISSGAVSLPESESNFAKERPAGIGGRRANINDRRSGQGGGDEKDKTERNRNAHKGVSV